MILAMLLSVGVATATPAWQEPAPFPGPSTVWNGFARHDFEFDGRPCVVVEPAEAAAGRPWIWRARFFGHEPQTDLALLEHGFHLAYIDVAGMYGSPRAVTHWNAFHELLTSKHGLAERVALEGMSRGGLIIFNWAKAHPESVACIYADAPVCDVRSWPGGSGASSRRPPQWRECLAEYALDEASAAEFSGNPIDGLAPLAEALVPVLAICGAADQVVPLAENTTVLAERYRELGGSIFVVAKEGVGHHPHSLADPRLIVDFVLRHTVGSGDSFTLRSGLARSRSRFEEEKRGRVAFLGGSITYNPGWRDLVGEDLHRRYPETQFDFIAAGIPSMGSTPGAFRLERDVLSAGRIDLLFVEAAVNDSTNMRSEVEWRRGMEGIVRHARRANPEIDVVMMHFVDPDKMERYLRGEMPPVIVAHERVAEHYQVPSVELAREVTERIQNGEFTWKNDFKNLHPSPFGQRLYFESISRLFDAAWGSGTSVIRTATPPPLDAASYDAGTIVDISTASTDDGWRRIDSWRPTDGAGTRRGFVDVPMLVSDLPGSTLRFPFSGRAVGVWVAAGPDAGQIEYRIDGGAWESVELFTRWSGRLHLPWLHVLEARASGGEHVLELRVGEGRHSKSRGTAVRIGSFVANGFIGRTVPEQK
jgi:sialidase-1